MGQTISRSEAREVAFRAVFAGACEGAVELALDDKKACEPELKFINKILTTFTEKQSEIDAQISAHLSGWTIDRLNKTDLAVLRVAAAEKIIGEVPPAVIVNECVNIAKRYSADGAGAFVNGVLSKIVG